MARPTIPPHERSMKQVNVRLTPEQFAQVSDKAERAGTTISGFMRDAALGRRVAVQKTTAPDFMTRNELRRIGVNLNQIAHAMNAGGVTSPDRLDAIAGKLDHLFDQWLALDP